MSIIQNIFVKMDLQGKSTVTISRQQIPDLSSLTKVKKLKQAIKDKEGVDDIRLIFGGKQLSKDECTLDDYGISNDSTLFCVLRLLGGAQDPGDAGHVYEFKKEAVEKLKNIKIGEEKVDIRVEDNDKCGTCWDKKAVAVIHGDDKVCAQCMANWTRGKVFNGDAEIKCPGSCGVVVPSFVAFTICGLSEEKYKEWDLQLNKNAMCFKECPNKNCGQFIMKEFKEQRVRCPRCKAYEFCWTCLEKWKGVDNIHCGNPTCTAVAEAMKILEESWNRRNDAANEKIGGIAGVPKTRICPNPGCLRVNEHAKNCKRMTCSGKGGCKHQYCHVCLKKWSGCNCAYCQFRSGKVEECGYGGGKCNVHPLQKF